MNTQFPVSTFIRPESSSYELTACLGEGLSSRVFAAIRQDSRGFSKQEVVLKILKSGTDVSWLKREFNTLSTVRSPHCVGIYGWENLSDGPALVLEKINGLNLRELAKHRKLKASEIKEILAQLRSGLEAVHASGLCHGDLSPSNIMIDTDGIVRLIDFALDTRPGIKVGTPAYLAPEIWDGEAISKASDLFSVGLLIKDLESDFKQTPTSPAKARIRAKIFAEREGLLAESPANRDFPNLESSDFGRIQLSSLVCEALAERSRGVTGTMILEQKKQRWRKKIGGSFRAALIVALSVMILPAFSYDRSEKTASLEVRSHHWLEISIDEKSYGYTPVVIKDLKAGVHRLKWRSAQDSGERQVFLMPGETLRMGANELHAW